MKDTHPPASPPATDACCHTPAPPDARPSQGAITRITHTTGLRGRGSRCRG
jgi:hypothetical protein